MEVVTKGDLDPAARDAAQQELRRMLKAPEVTSAAAQEIGRLTETVREIRAANRKIRADLFNFDNAQFRDKRGARIRLGPKWDAFSKASPKQFGWRYLTR